MNDEERKQQIQEEIKQLAKKYNFQKIIFLGQETDDTKNLKCRITIYSKQKEKEFDVHEFALFWEACLKLSKTLREISNHMAEHLMHKVFNEAFKEQSIDAQLQKGAKRAD